MSFDTIMVQDRIDRIIEWIHQLDTLAKLPRETFMYPRNAAAAESFMRRSLEAIFDIGRHLLARSGRVDLAQEYKAIARGLVAIGAVDRDTGAILEKMAGYRNRLVHFYHEVTMDELYEIILHHRDDLLRFTRQIVSFLEHHTNPTQNDD